MDGGSNHHVKCSSQRLENIEEEGPTSWLSASLPPPETPTETMEFLARSWSLSAMELSKALSDTFVPSSVLENTPTNFTNRETQNSNPRTTVSSAEPSRTIILQPLTAVEPFGVSPPISPRNDGDLKLYRSAPWGKTMSGWLRDQKEKRRAETRSRNAEIYAATSAAGVAAAVAALATGTVFSPDHASATRSVGNSKTAAAIASAAALVASHCVEMAQAMGASRDQILAVIHSAVNAQTTGDIMALTAGAATALRGAAALRARLHKGIQNAALTGESKESDGCSAALNFVHKGEELLKRTRKGILHWKQVSVCINSSWQVVVKMKSTHMAGTFVKKKKSVVTDVCSEIPSWLGREVGDGSNQRAYFGIKTPERLIEFECRNKCEKQIWVEGIRQMLNCRANMNIAMLM